MPVGASPKREREYQKLKRKFKQEGRYEGQQEEVAVRIVNKQRAESGETKRQHHPLRRTAARSASRRVRSSSRPAKSS
jgi:hypothetical protein